MSLKKPNHKIQSSFAGFEFTNKELVFLQNNFDRKILINLPSPTIQYDSQFDQIVEILKIAMLSYHVEVLKQSLYEYITLYKQQSYHDIIKNLEELVTFLSILRNGLLHVKGELIPRWEISKNDDKKKDFIEKFIKKPFVIFIPILSSDTGLLYKET